MKKYIYALALGVAAFPAMAQQHPALPKSGIVEVVNTGERDTTLYKIMQFNAPQSFQAPGAPRFALGSKNGKFYLGITGTVKGTASFDFGDPIDDASLFTTSNINMHPTKGNGGKFQASAAQSNIALQLVALPGTKDQIGGYVSMNFLGGNPGSYTPTLQFGYLTWRGFTAGYDFGVFTDPSTMPPTIDYEGPDGATTVPKVVLDYRHEFKNGIGVGVGIEQTEASFTPGKMSEQVNQRVPDIPAYVQYSWGKGAGHVRLSGIVRTLTYRDLLADKNRNHVGWGVQLSSTTPLAGGFLQGYWSGVYGKGVSSYFQDITGMGLDLMPSATEPGRLSAPKAWGGYVGLQYNFSKNVFATTTYSMVHVDADRYLGGATPWADQYKRAQYAVANVFWTPVPMLQLGLEYIYGQRKDNSGLSKHDNRIQMMAQLSF